MALEIFHTKKVQTSVYITAGRLVNALILVLSASSIVKILTIKAMVSKYQP